MIITIRKWKAAVANSSSWRGVARYLGIKYHSGLKKIILEQVPNINFSHFTHKKKRGKHVA